MSVIRVIDRAGTEHVLEARPGLKAKEIIRDAGLPIEAACGGSCACATCHVHVAEDWVERVGAQSEAEADLLDLAGAVRPTSRLSCQIVFLEELDGLQVELAPEQRMVRGRAPRGAKAASGAPLGGADAPPERPCLATDRALPDGCGRRARPPGAGRRRHSCTAPSPCGSAISASVVIWRQ